MEQRRIPLKQHDDEGWTTDTCSHLAIGQATIYPKDISRSSSNHMDLARRGGHRTRLRALHHTIILTVDKVLSKIRNKTMRELPGGTLFPDTMKQYDEYTIREAMHNAIAHQDYTLQQRIVFVEGPSTLYYGNGGSFIPGTIENALEHKGPQLHYRNECLCRGMVNFNMIDTVGRGIKKIYTEQRNRFFPMPDYEIDNEHRTVGVTIYGKMIDEKYTNLLKTNNSLSLKECLWLDAVQNIIQSPKLPQSNFTTRA